MNFEVEGILFQPIPKETVSFDIAVGDACYNQHQHQKKKKIKMFMEKVEVVSLQLQHLVQNLAPQVQQLREIKRQYSSKNRFRHRLYDNF